MLALRFFCVLFCLSLCLSLAADLSTNWFATYGGSGNDEATASCFDSAGNFYVAGNFTGTLTIGSQTLNSVVLTNDHTSIFVAKFSSTGQFSWAKQSVGSGGNRCVAYLNSICADESGNVYICGKFKNKLGFSIPSASSLSSPNNDDIFVAKVNAAGDFVWAKQAGGSGVDDTANSICLATDGNPVLCGDFSGYADLFGIYVTSAGSTDIFIAKLSSTDGSRILLTTFGAISTDTANSICAAPDGSFAFIGSYTGSIAFGSTILNKVGKEAYLCLLNSSLAPVWAKSSEGTGTQEGDTIAADSSGIYISGRYSNAVSFDASMPTLPNVGYAIFSAKLSLTGNYLWLKSMGAVSNYNRCFSSYVDANSDLFLAGSYTNSFGTLTSAGSSDGFVIKIDTNGNILWAQSFGGTGADIANSICGNTAGQVLCIGYYNAGNPNFLGNTPTNSGLKDIFAILFSEVDAETPAAPQNFHIEKIGSGLRLSWDAVNFSEIGTPISISGYKVYYSPTPVTADFQYLGQCEGTNFDLLGADLIDDIRFYTVKAYR